MKVITDLHELLSLPGKHIGFFRDVFNPPQFAHLDFIKKAIQLKNLNHIIICAQTIKGDNNIEELKHRLRIMDLMFESTDDSNIYVLSSEICSGIESNIYIDDIFFLLKRRKKELFALVGCDSLKECAEFFKSVSVTFIVGCKIKRTEAEKTLLAEKMNCIFIDDIIPCPAEQLKDEVAQNNIYLSNKMQEYIEANHLYGFNKDHANYN